MSHALLSASSSHRWLVCTPSARLEEQFPDTVSIDAKKGSLAHEIAELKLRKEFVARIGPQKYKAALKKFQDHELYEAEMERCTNEYLDYVRGVVHGFNAKPYIAIEKRVDFSAYVPEAFGTADCIVIGGDVLHIIDYKHGKGVPVSGEVNSQMRLYALGAFLMFQILYPITTIRTTIFQPRIDRISEEEFAATELLSWGESIKPIAIKAFAGEGEAVEGDHCRFCRAISRCHTIAAFNTQLAPEIEKLPPLLTDEEVGRYLKLGKDIAAWLSRLEEYALSALLAGGDIPGWKAVEGRSVRQWKDADAAFATLVAAGLNEAILYERKPLTLAAIEKVVGKKDFATAVGAFVETPPGKPALAQESDSRPEITNRITAEEAFREEI